MTMTFSQAVEHVKDMRNHYESFQVLADVLEKAAQAENVIAEAKSKLGSIETEVHMAKIDADAKLARFAEDHAAAMAAAKKELSEITTARSATSNALAGLRKEIAELTTQRDGLRDAVETLRKSVANVGAG